MTSKTADPSMSVHARGTRYPSVGAGEAQILQCCAAFAVGQGGEVLAVEVQDVEHDQCGWQSRRQRHRRSAGVQSPTQQVKVRAGVPIEGDDLTVENGGSAP